MAKRKIEERATLPSAMAVYPDPLLDWKQESGMLWTTKVGNRTYVITLYQGVYTCKYGDGREDPMRLVAVSSELRRAQYLVDTYQSQEKT